MNITLRSLTSFIPAVSTTGLIIGASIVALAALAATSYIYRREIFDIASMLSTTIGEKFTDVSAFLSTLSTRLNPFAKNQEAARKAQEAEAARKAQEAEATLKIGKFFTQKVKPFLVSKKQAEAARKAQEVKVARLAQEVSSIEKSIEYGQQRSSSGLSILFSQSMISTVGLFAVAALSNCFNPK